MDYESNRAIFLYNAYDSVMRVRRVLKGVRMSHVWTIGIIGTYEGKGMTEIGKLVGVNRHTINSRIRTLMKVGLGYKQDGKLYLTDKGREVFEILEKGFAEGLDLFLKAALKEHLKRSGGLVAEDGQEYKRKKPRPE